MAAGVVNPDSPDGGWDSDLGSLAATPDFVRFLYGPRLKPLRLGAAIWTSAHVSQILYLTHLLQGRALSQPLQARAQLLHY